MDGDSGEGGKDGLCEGAKAEPETRVVADSVARTSEEAAESEGEKGHEGLSISSLEREVGLAWGK